MTTPEEDPTFSDDEKHKQNTVQYLKYHGSGWTRIPNAGLHGSAWISPIVKGGPVEWDVRKTTSEDNKDILKTNTPNNGGLLWCDEDKLAKFITENQPEMTLYRRFCDQAKINSTPKKKKKGVNQKKKSAAKKNPGAMKQTDSDAVDLTSE